MRCEGAGLITRDRQDIFDWTKVKKSVSLSTGTAQWILSVTLQAGQAANVRLHVKRPLPRSVGPVGIEARGTSSGQQQAVYEAQLTLWKVIRKTPPTVAAAEAAVAATAATAAAEATANTPSSPPPAATRTAPPASPAAALAAAAPAAPKATAATAATDFLQQFIPPPPPRHPPPPPGRQQQQDEFIPSVLREVPPPPPRRWVEDGHPRASAPLFSGQGGFPLTNVSGEARGPSPWRDRKQPRAQHPPPGYAGASSSRLL